MSTSGCTYLKNKNPFEREKRIKFDDSIDPETGYRRHDYYIDGSKENIVSTTTIIHRHFPKFDTKAIIKKILKNKRWSSDPGYKYYQKSAEEINAMWDKNRDYAAERGTAMHLNIERYFNKAPHEVDSIEFKMFKVFVSEHPELIPFRTELEVFDEKHRLAGSIDMLFTDITGKKIWIYDWKRSKEFKYTNRWQSALIPELAHLDDCNVNHYGLQLNMYKYYLETYYLEDDQYVDGMFLVRIHPDAEKYERLEIPDMRAEIDIILEERYCELNGGKKKALEYSNDLLDNTECLL